MHDENCFITLTYSDDKLPELGSLHLPDWQTFAKKFRKKLGPFRFYHCGEYGEETGRPHYHAAIFGHDFHADRRPWANRNGNQTYVSPTLTYLWPHGLHEIGSLTFQSAAYVARYIMKKQNGKNAITHYETNEVDLETGEVLKLKPEYTTMSRRPGIGKHFFDAYASDIFPSDECIVNGKKTRPPRFYDSQYELIDPEGMRLLKMRRITAGRKYRHNHTPERLRDRETCARAKLRPIRRDSI